MQYPANAAEPEAAFGDPPEIKALSAAVIDANTGEFLYTKNADEPRAVASTQKLLVALLILDAGGLDEEMEVQSTDRKVIGSKLGLKPGQKYSRRQLVMTLLVKSANDVAVALARDNAGTEQGFVDKMNARARELGAKNTRFRNPHGLTERGQYSTARDMALIARAAWQRPEVRNFAMVRRLNFQHPDGSTTELENTNKLLDEMIAATGLKTGTTRAAGFCLVASASAGEQDVIAVVLGSTENKLNEDAGSLMVWALQGLEAPVPEADVKKYGGSAK